ncbi:N-acetylmuramoyl-L-alanine amidase [Longimicrobium sp.]|uniref:N-acetylmuramoyl-L-alanine amidase family protein n=1 Tax=Longimicrobium sp. TaxID=2029185 RepID=UPI002B832A67|nr:N-acetylmuramoyl-L-alanine amidase [Longimicrobium sp.]HSU17780.1 N-acetylmuramoyl-L-alanine amidase [Longimicrobium sp.]
MTVFRPSTLLAVLALAAACKPTPPATGPAPSGPPAPLPYVPLTSGLPPIPAVDAPLAIRLIAPESGQARPRRDSTFLYGTVGTGGAALAINGAQVPVAPNGAFLAYLPVPADGRWTLSAFRNGQRADAVYQYRLAAAAPRATSDTATEAGPATDSAAARPAAPAESEVFATPRTGTVARGGDTLATGSDAVYARPTPAGTYRWFFPRGTRLQLLERRRAQYRVRLDTTVAWIDTVNVRPSADAARVPAIGGPITLAAGAAPELRIPAAFAPFLVTTDSAGVHVTVYGQPGAAELRVATDDFVAGATQDASAPGELRVDVALSRWLWGYKAFYDRDGTLVVRIRRPPRIDAANPLRGIHIVVDPGHPPAGTIGPTGFMEKDANLAIGLRLAERLRAAGAVVSLTRTADVSVDLAARPEQAVRENADLLLSVHNNAFGEEANPFRDHGTSTYWFQPNSAGLASTLDRRIAAVTMIPDLGAKWGNLALVRPTWMPSCLTESLYMPIPEQEAALRDPGFLDRLAEAHIEGIADFLRLRADR